MTREELKKGLKDISDRYENAAYEIKKRFAEENNEINIGDVVTDHYHTIRVERMDMYIGFRDVPEMRYYGTDVKKDGTPCKRQTNAPVFQGNVEFVNGNKYDYPFKS